VALSYAPSLDQRARVLADLPLVDDADGFRFLRPDGREMKAVGGGPALVLEPVESPRERHRAEGIAIDAWMAFPRWDGQPPGYEHAVFCLIQQEGSPSHERLVRVPLQVPREPGPGAPSRRSHVPPRSSTQALREVFFEA
jgi:hypothetical protein